MPSHSPYALSNLTLVKFSNFSLLELHKNKRFLFEIEVYPYISLSFSLMLGKTFNFPHLFDIQSLIDIGVCILRLSNWYPWIFSSFSSLSSFVTHYLVFKVQLIEWHSLLCWWRWGESNSWPPACKAGALPAELHPQIYIIGGPKWTRTTDLTLIRRAL